MAATEYVLMNQDIPVLDFTCRRNEFDEPEFFEGTWHVDYRPIGYRGLAAFLEHRKAPKHREHIRQLLEKYDLVPSCGISLAAATVRGLILTVSHKEQIGELYPQVLETLVYGACRELFE